MTTNEELPTLICNECALHLNVAYNFKKKTLHAEKLFLDALAGGENEDRKVPPLAAVVPQMQNGMATGSGKWVILAFKFVEFWRRGNFYS